MSDAQGNDAAGLMSGVQRRCISSTERARKSRQRKREGLRVLRIDIRETEVDTLAKIGLLHEEDREDIGAVAEAIYRVFDVVFTKLESGKLKI
jgi:hypothetical protein